MPTSRSIISSKAHVAVAIIIIIVTVVVLILLLVRAVRQRRFETRKLLMTKQDVEESIRFHLNQLSFSKPTNIVDQSPSTNPLKQATSEPLIKIAKQAFDKLLPTKSDVKLPTITKQTVDEPIVDVLLPAVAKQTVDEPVVDGLLPTVAKQTVDEPVVDESWRTNEQAACKEFQMDSAISFQPLKVCRKRPRRSLENLITPSSLHLKENVLKNSIADVKLDEHDDAILQEAETTEMQKIETPDDAIKTTEMQEIKTLDDAILQAIETTEMQKIETPDDSIKTTEMQEIKTLDDSIETTEMQEIKTHDDEVETTEIQEIESYETPDNAILQGVESIETTEMQDIKKVETVNGETSLDNPDKHDDAILHETKNLDKAEDAKQAETIGELDLKKQVHVDLLDLKAKMNLVLAKSRELSQPFVNLEKAQTSEKQKTRGVRGRKKKIN